MPTVTARGTGGNNTAATSLTCTPGSNMAAGSMGVLVVALDNAGSAGSTIIAPPGPVTDSAGNIWTRRSSGVNDPGAASAGTEFAMYTAQLTKAFTTANNIILYWGTPWTSPGAVSTAAKAYAFWEVVPTAGYMMYFSSQANANFSSNTAPTITSSSLAVNDVIIGGIAIEASAGTISAADTDTTGGTWSANQTAGFGTTTSGMVVGSQAKVITAAGTQTYNVTIGTGLDCTIGWCSLSERTNGVHFAPFFFA